MKMEKSTPPVITYELTPEWFDNAASVARLTGPGEWGVDLTPNKVRLGSKLKARRYTGPVNDPAKKSGMRHTYKYTPVEIVGKERNVNGITRITLSFPRLTNEGAPRRNPVMPGRPDPAEWAVYYDNGREFTYVENDLRTPRGFRLKLTKEKRRAKLYHRHAGSFAVHRFRELLGRRPGRIGLIRIRF